MGAQKVDLAGKPGQPVAETAVDGAFRRPEKRHGLAPLVDVVELCPHELGEDALPAMGRQARRRR